MTEGLIPDGFGGVEAQLWQWMVLMIRPGAAFLVAPLFSARNLPLQIRLILALAIGIAAGAGPLAAAPLRLPEAGLASLDGVLIVMGEVLAGLAIGFVLQMGLAGAMIAGELIAGAMGLSFATMVDPTGAASAPILSSLLALIALMLFIGIDGHLLLISLIVKSYAVWPPGSGMIAGTMAEGLALFGSHVFMMGLVIALPVTSAVIFAQLIMGMLARTAPQLNLFAVGFPVAILLGLLLLAISLPLMAQTMLWGISEAMSFAGAMVG